MNSWKCLICLAWAALALGMGACSWPTEARTVELSQKPQIGPSPDALAGVAVIPTPSPLPSSIASPAPSPTPSPSPTPMPTARDLALRYRFTAPVVGAHVPEWLELVPGASREYRSGTHEGVDFGFDAVGVSVIIGTRVVAAGDGVVLRADVDYMEPSRQEMDEILARSKRLGGTAPADLDRLRGRQVWIDHGKGVVTRYAHLEDVALGIAPGSRVFKGQLIAYVGSSGVPSEGAGPEPHLHFEIRLGDTYLGQSLPPDLARELYVEALGGID